LGKRRVVISRTEVGMVNAATATTLLIQEYAPEVIINQGTAGATHPELEVGDIIIGATSVDYGAVRTPPRIEGDGIDIDAWQAMPRRLRIGDERVSFERFDSDPELVKIAQTIPYDGGRLIVGSVGSADQFNREIDKLAWARKLFAIDSEDMESAAVAQVSRAFGVRFVPIRIISDNEYHGGVFYREKGEVCARYVLNLLQRLSE
jgi:adenosylhomocysteine nucleosidase